MCNFRTKFVGDYKFRTGEQITVMVPVLRFDKMSIPCWVASADVKGDDVKVFYVTVSDDRDISTTKFSMYEKNGDVCEQSIVVGLKYPGCYAKFDFTIDQEWTQVSVYVF